jgi:hypothetical protein
VRKATTYSVSDPHRHPPRKAPPPSLLPHLLNNSRNPSLDFPSARLPLRLNDFDWCGGGSCEGAGGDGAEGVAEGDGDGARRSLGESGGRGGERGGAASAVDKSGFEGLIENPIE